jgi:hypothetical protein
MSPRREGGSEKRAEKDKVLRIKGRINNGPAEARRKESNKNNNMKSKGHKRKKCIHWTMQLSSLILQQCSSPPRTQSTMKGVTLK